MSVRTVHLHLPPTRRPPRRNVWPVTVHRAVFLGDMTQAHVQWGDRELVVRHTNLQVPRASRPISRPTPPNACYWRRMNNPEPV